MCLSMAFCSNFLEQVSSCIDLNMTIYTYTGVAAYQEDLEASSDNGKLFPAYVKHHQSCQISSL